MADFTLSLQVSPWSILMEGVDPALDLLRDAGVDGLHLNSHTYYDAGIEPGKRALYAQDHPPVHDFVGRFERAWVRHDPADYEDLGLFHLYGEAGPSSDEFDRIVAGARERGMRVHARYLDGWESARRAIPGWTEICCLDARGERLPIPCFSQPRVREWARRTAVDIARSGVDGLFYGIERGTPLADALFSQHQTAYCFCDACKRLADEDGLDFDAIHAGLLRILDINQAAKAPQYGECALRDVLRVLFDCPDLLRFDTLHEQNKRRIEREMGAAFKQQAPEKSFSSLVFTEHDPVKAIHEDWNDVAEHVDAMVLRSYQHIQGPRIAEASTNAARSGPLWPMSDDFRRELRWHVGGGSGLACPTHDELMRHEGGIEHVRQSAARLVKATAGRCEPQAAVGADISHPFDHRIDTPPEYTKAMITALQDAGVRSFILCREYQELSATTLHAAGDAVKR
jgi:hypothetical protein